MELVLPKTKYKTYLLYSSGEKEIADTICIYLKHLERQKDSKGRQKDYGPIISKEVTLKENSEFARKIIKSNTLIVIYLISCDFVRAKAEFIRALELFIIEHNCKRIRLLPVLTDGFSITETPFRKIKPINPEGPAFKQIPQGACPNSYTALTLNISSEILSAIERQRKIDEQWQAAQKENTEESYRVFYEKNKLCKYGNLAQAKHYEIMEKRLWKEALEGGELSHYLNYLKKAPLNNHKNKAIVKIIEGEHCEEVIMGDIDKSSNLSFLMERKSRIESDNNIIKSKQKIERQFGKPLEDWIGERSRIETLSNLLGHEIHQVCSKNEIYSFNYFEKYTDTLDRKIKELIKKVESQRGLLAIYVGSFLLFLVLFAPIINDLFDGLLFSVVSDARVIVVSVSIAILTFRAFQIMSMDIRNYEEKRRLLLKKVVELKVSFLINNKVDQSQAILFFNDTDNWIEEKKAKRILDYFYTKKKNNEAEGIKPRVRQVHQLPSI